MYDYIQQFIYKITIKYFKKYKGGIVNRPVERKES